LRPQVFLAFALPVRMSDHVIIPPKSCYVEGALLPRFLLGTRTCFYPTIVKFGNVSITEFILLVAAISLHVSMSVFLLLFALNASIDRIWNCRAWSCAPLILLLNEFLNALFFSALKSSKQ